MVLTIVNSKKLSADKIKNLPIHIPITESTSVEIGRIIDVTDDYIYCELDPDFAKSLTKNDMKYLSFEIEIEEGE